MLLAEIVRTSQLVAGSASRKQKVALLAQRLSAAASTAEVEIVASFLRGSLRQRRTGVGWRGAESLPAPAPVATLTVTQVDTTFAELAQLSGPGSQGARAQRVQTLFAAATPAEQLWLQRVITGGVRQGALDALLQEAIAQSAAVPLAVVRRAAMLSGSTLAMVRSAFAGGVTELEQIRLQVGRPILPMLASSAPSVAAALAKLGGGQVCVDTKLDGIRIQLHRNLEQVLVVSRSLDDLTARLPQVCRIAQEIPAESFVLDGEAIALDAHGRPRPFAETASLGASTASSDQGGLRPYFFDLLHLNGRDFLDAPARERGAALTALLPAHLRVPRLLTGRAEEAESFAAKALAAGHEGVVIKSLAAPYEAGRRGASWVKVKPVHTVDLVVLAVEWGSGRRQGWLSNIHLGARHPDRPGEFVMLGKTFKGMTDEMLKWQTERFLELETRRTEHTVYLRPEQVVEIAFDGVQRSTRYPGGIALRFARVVRYRDDKTPQEANSLDDLPQLLT